MSAEPASAVSSPPVRVPTQRVKVIDIDLPFGKIVFLLVKWSLAAVPAMIILGIMGTTLAMVLTFVFGPAFL